MAFQQSAVYRHPQRTITTRSQESSSSVHVQPHVPPAQSQEWVLFSPSQAESSTDQTRTAGLSHLSDLGSLNTAARSGQPQSSVLDEDITEDGDLDSLDDGLHAFREPPTYRTLSDQANVPVLPAHDGLGTFQASSSLVLEKLWQHEQHNPKRKHEGLHHQPSSLQRQLETVEEMEIQANEEKRIRIEKWRIEQSQALLEEVEKETRHQMRKQFMQQSGAAQEIGRSTTIDFTREKQDDLSNEPFWRRITRKFIRDVIGIDEPLLSVILGESLPGEETPRPSSPATSPRQDSLSEQLHQQNWRDKLLQRIAKELGVFVHQISPHPGAFSAYLSASPSADYAGIPIRTKPQADQAESNETKAEDLSRAFSSTLTPNFPPTLKDPAHAESWGFEDEPDLPSSKATLDLRQEREYWERELDVKMVFRFLADKFTGYSSQQQQQHSDSMPPSQSDASATRAAIIRQHHPLVARAQRSPVRLRRESRATRRPTSSCASESVKSGHRALRSGSSRNYWDIGGSAGSGSLMASGGMMGAWGET